jgi:uncharacterized membrane protein
MQIPKDPIVLSLAIGCVAFIISLIILAIKKPKMVTKINKEKKRTIEWFRLLLVSIMILLAISICVFLVLTKDRKTKAKMGFHPNY